MPKTLPLVEEDCAVAGRNHLFIEEWKELSSDPVILSAVQGYSIGFMINPVQLPIPHPINMGKQESYQVDAQIHTFLKKGIIVESTHERGEFISNIFLRPKKDGSFRMILNLRELNKFVMHYHLMQAYFAN